MFEDALLESSPRRASVLRRNHYLISMFAGTLFFAQGLYLLPLLLLLADRRALFVTSAMLGVAATLTTLMLCYVGVDARQQDLRAWPWLGIALLLNLPGFLVYLVYSAWKSGDWKRAAIPLAYVTESLLVGVMVLVPLIYTQALPTQSLLISFHVTPPRGRPAGQPAPQPTPIPHHPRPNMLTAPIHIPDHVAMVVEPPAPPQTNSSPVGPYIEGAQTGPGSGNDFIVGSAPWATEQPPPPPPTPAQQPAATKLVRISCGVIAAKGLYQPPPEYPQLAKLAHIEGTVVLEAIIGIDGTINNLKIIRGQPLLARAALDAVKVWRYQPTLLNGESVEVLTEIDVNFKLGE